MPNTFSTPRLNQQDQLEMYQLSYEFQQARLTDRATRTDNSVPRYVPPVPTMSDHPGSSIENRTNATLSRSENAVGNYSVNSRHTADRRNLIPLPDTPREASESVNLLVRSDTSSQHVKASKEMENAKKPSSLNCAGLRLNTQISPTGSCHTTLGRSSDISSSTVSQVSNDEQRRDTKNPFANSCTGRVHPHFIPGELSLLGTSTDSTPELTPSSSSREALSSTQSDDIDAVDSDESESSSPGVSPSSSQKEATNNTTSNDVSECLYPPVKSSRSTHGFVSRPHGPGSRKRTGDQVRTPVIRKTWTIHTNHRQKRDISDDDEDPEDGQHRKQPPNNSRNGFEDESDARLLACPYYKHEPARYSRRNRTEKDYGGCEGKRLSTIPRLKQHLQRVHQRPKIYCGRCYKVFNNAFQLENHSRLEIQCLISPLKYQASMTDVQAEEIKERRPGITVEQNWIFIWNILFPHEVPPASVYMDTPVERPQQFQGFDGDSVINDLDSCQLRDITQPLGADDNWSNFQNDCPIQVQGGIHQPYPLFLTPKYPISQHPPLYVQDAPSGPPFQATLPTNIPRPLQYHYLPLTPGNPFDDATYNPLDHSQLDTAFHRHADLAQYEPYALPPNPSAANPMYVGEGQEAAGKGKQPARTGPTMLNWRRGLDAYH